MLFGENFKVIKEFESIFKNIGKYEEFYAFEKDGKLKYGILDKLFGQPSAANWVDSPYANMMKKRAEKCLQELIDNGNIEIIGD